MDFITTELVIGLSVLIGAGLRFLDGRGWGPGWVAKVLGLTIALPLLYLGVEWWQAGLISILFTLSLFVLGWTKWEDFIYMSVRYSILPLLTAAILLSLPALIGVIAGPLVAALYQVEIRLGNGRDWKPLVESLLGAIVTFTTLIVVII